VGIVFGGNDTLAYDKDVYIGEYFEEKDEEFSFTPKKKSL